MPERQSSHESSLSASSSRNEETLINNLKVVNDENKSLKRKLQANEDIKNKYEVACNDLIKVSEKLKVSINSDIILTEELTSFKEIYATKQNELIVAESQLEELSMDKFSKADDVKRLNTKLQYRDRQLSAKKGELAKVKSKLVPIKADLQKNHQHIGRNRDAGSL